MGLGVALGAFGAHGLKDQLSAYQLDIFKTGVEYQFLHGLAILLLAALGDKVKWGTKKTATLLFLLGTLFFSGSLYGLATKDLHGISVSWLGPITPLGGILLIIGWAYIFISSFREKK